MCHNSKKEAQISAFQKQSEQLWEILLENYHVGPSDEQLSLEKYWSSQF